MRERRARPLIVPQCGVIKGGRLNGWRFHFLQFRVDAGALKVVAKCTPPNWPFPCDIALDSTHFTSLRPVVGDRAKRLEATALILTAYSHAKREAPAWVINHTGTLRAAVKRATPTQKG